MELKLSSISWAEKSSVRSIKFKRAISKRKEEYESYRKTANQNTKWCDNYGR